jgi:hypothetical protein
MADSKTCLFNTGNAPGIAKQTGHTFVLAGAPNSVEQPQKALVFVLSWQWTSSPTTSSYSTGQRQMMVMQKFVR